MKEINKTELIEILNKRFDNNYLCTGLKSVADYEIADLFLHETEDNYYLIKKRDDFFLADAFINKKNPKLTLLGTIILEYAFKRKKKEFIDIIKSLGFQEIMTRKLMRTSANGENLPFTILNKSFLGEVLCEIKASFDMYYGSIPAETELSKRFNNGEVIGLLDGENLMGFVEFSQTQSSLRIEHIAVCEKYRGLGKSKDLIKSLFGVAKAKNIPFVELFVNANNDIARKLYEKMGFKEDKLETIVFRRD
ncbi:MAG: GNAT family N-acetyltransferase [Ezakiella sp.]|nr:GNAT family N-acetyltransferase [Ezakiella sp.]MDD7471200.1 GNAT family N-acetyltransferase [Bacillota bacterium]MDY3923337.1 GNAT family N-acetyltransferase [Ezakiella sp.]